MKRKLLRASQLSALVAVRKAPSITPPLAGEKFTY